MNHDSSSLGSDSSCCRLSSSTLRGTDEEDVSLDFPNPQLKTYNYCKLDQASDVELYSALKERHLALCILLGGTSGCGKSTLSSFLADRLNISTVISTDHIRQVLRSYSNLEENPVVFCSSYDAGTKIQCDKSISMKERTILGYRQQSHLLVDDLDRLIGSFQRRKKSLIIEGVHLSIDIMYRLVEKYPLCIPFLLYISNKSKHRERFAIRAKYMTLEPKMNRYMKYFEKIRTIQEYLCQQAELYHISRIDNTNMDRTLVILHRVLYNVLSRHFLQKGDTSSSSLPRGPEPSISLAIISEEFTKTMKGICGSKEMIKWIQRNTKPSSDQLVDPTHTIKNIMTTEMWLPSVDEDMLSVEDTVCAAIHL